MEKRNREIYELQKFRIRYTFKLKYSLGLDNKTQNTVSKIKKQLCISYHMHTSKFYNTRVFFTTSHIAHTTHTCTSIFISLFVSSSHLLFIYFILPLLKYAFQNTCHSPPSVGLRNAGNF